MGEELGLRRFPGYDVEVSEEVGAPSAPPAELIDEVEQLKEYTELFKDGATALHELLEWAKTPGKAEERAVPYDLYTDLAEAMFEGGYVFKVDEVTEKWHHRRPA